MWKRKSYFSVPVEERMEFQAKLERLYLSYGQHIEVIQEVTERNPLDSAHMQVKHTEDGEFDVYSDIFLRCGAFWYEEDNILPLVAMTHELGHFVDMTQNFNNFYEYKGIGLFEYEVRAWEYAVKFCNELGISQKYGEQIVVYARTCLKTYFDFINSHWFEYMNQETFDEGINRLVELLGLDCEPSEPEEIQPWWVSYKPQPVEEKRAIRHQEQGRRVVSFNPVIETPKKKHQSPLERKREMQRNRQRQIKKAMRAKSWEL